MRFSLSRDARSGSGQGNRVYNRPLTKDFNNTT